MIHTALHTLRVGTRGSALAQAQTASVVRMLREQYPDLQIETAVIRTSGDLQQREVLGAFVKELQEALLDGRIDVAVHSLKDLPTQPVKGLALAAVPPRADPRDVCLCREGDFWQLPSGARVGTGSPRRSAQLRARRSDLQYLPLVGNVDTRIRKLHEGQYDAIVLAAAGLQRLGFLENSDDRHVPLPDGSELRIHLFDLDTVLPAPGQGALAVECRVDNEAIRSLLSVVDHLPSRQEVTAERAFLQAIGGGCRVPIAAYAKVEGQRLRLRGLVAHPEGQLMLSDQMEGEAEHAEVLGIALAQRLLARGASGLMEA
ncbi:MAG: hydroxymethylbilane synthase [bacterium]|nr:hydroxymethylbilane synthase [bacterium]